MSPVQVCPEDDRDWGAGPADTSGSDRRATPRWDTVLLLLLVLVVGVGCSTPQRRPSVEEWNRHWEAVQAAIPSLEEVSDPPSGALCTRGLVTVREARGDLLPTPDPAVDGPVEEWIQVAESVFFQCPPHTPPVDSFEAGYEEMQRFVAEVEAGLTLEGDRSGRSSSVVGRL